MGSETLSGFINNFISRLVPYSSRIYNLSGSTISLFLSLVKEPFVMITEDEESADRILKDILFYRGVINPGVIDTPVAPQGKPCLLPKPDSPCSSGERAKVIYAFGSATHGSLTPSIITTKDALKADVWQPLTLKKNVLHLRTGQETARLRIKEGLEELGYKQVALVAEKGQFSMRQWLLDIFPSAEENPIRVEFFGDVIEGLRIFDTETQKSISEIRQCTVMPAREPLEQEAMPVMELLNGYEIFCGDNLPSSKGGIAPPCPHVLSAYAIKGGGVDAGLLPIRGLGIQPEERKDIEGLADAIKGLMKDNRIVIVSSSIWQAERMREILKDSGLIAPLIEMKDVLSYEGRLMVSQGELSSGLFMPGLLILTENEIFRRPEFRPIRKSRVSGLITSLDDLREGDYVVHKLHGIGKFSCLIRQNVEGSEYDLMAIEYQGGDKLYLPLYGIADVHKYHSSEGIPPRLDMLGSKKWQRAKERVRKKIKEMADKLLRLYAEREVVKGFAFSRDTELHREFDSFFLYEETPDQISSVREIEKDMASEKPMDRLLCGDVGYGKTEVAMRAAFRAVYDGKQVAVIVPTTLLCEQHFRTFKNRFSAFPVRIDYISRFKPKKEQARTIQAIGRGEIDIVIGTHALIREDVRFQDLGLLIIDEEHRFGVSQKEKIKELKKGVDVLSMTATPIPRTLQMAISGIRGMSVIETPPEERLAVKSVVSVFNDNLIKEALDKEVQRQGQVFFVHNRIEDIMKIGHHLRRLMPQLRIAVAHGQMPERQLEKIMLSFLNKEVDVLVSTAIIGSGLDIPSVNTIIINMADRMGLADLYQLKGRVGRGSQRAFACFLIPGWNIIPEEAKKRLQAIQELSYLGAGLRLAMKDLEIRGAGNLLGQEQSGYINTVGFDMYLEMLEAAASELKGVKIKEKVEPQISLSLSAFIPEDYIDDMMLRLTAYRKISGVKSADGLQAIKAEMADRFGPLPWELQNLLGIMGLRLMAEKLLITDIRQGNGKVRFIFSQSARVFPQSLLEEFKGRIRFFNDGFELSMKRDIFYEIQSVMEVLERQGTQGTQNCVKPK